MEDICRKSRPYTVVTRLNAAAFLRRRKAKVPESCRRREDRSLVYEMRGIPPPDSSLGDGMRIISPPERSPMLCGRSYGCDTLVPRFADMLEMDVVLSCRALQTCRKWTWYSVAALRRLVGNNLNYIKENAILNMTEHHNFWCQSMEEHYETVYCDTIF